MQTTHHAGKIAAIQQSFVPRIVASHLLLSRKQVFPSFTSPAHLVVRQKKSKLLLDSLHACMVEKNATLFKNPDWENGSAVY